MEPKTLRDEFLAYRAAVEDGLAQRNLIAAFGAGARAALEVLCDPYECPLCANRIIEVQAEVAKNFTPKKLEAGKRVRSEQ